VREALRRIEPLAVADRARTLSFIAAESAAVARLATWLLGGFAAIAMGLSAVGVYGVMSYRVRRRTRELGTRIALGATPAAIAWLVLRHAAGVVGLGLGLGVTAAMACGGALSSMLFGVTPRDLASMSSAAALLAGAGAVASYLPARRASRVNPVTALSSE
jgi:putative ABC transport system permease protein